MAAATVFVSGSSRPLALLNLRVCLVVLCVLLSSQQAVSQNSLYCTNPNGQQGQCIRLSTCPPLMSIIQRRPVSQENTLFLRRSQCGYEGNEPLVCCVNQRNANTDSVGDNAGPGLNLLPRRDVCGTYSASKIIGGEPTDLDDYPWAALLEYSRPNGPNGFYCGGSLINNKYVLTAAHCISGPSIPRGWRLASVRLGEYDTSTDQDCKQDACNDGPTDVPVDSTVVHPRYVPTSSNQENDIALVRLSRPVQFTRWIQPVCLPAISDKVTQNNFVGDEAVVAGWGKTETRSESNVKLQLRIPVVEDSMCVSRYQGSGVRLTSSQLCAGGRRGRDSCKGDSGGPLMSVDTENRQSNWFLIGVVSFGPSPCGTAGWPGVYTRVSAHNNWITQTIRA